MVGFTVISVDSVKKNCNEKVNELYDASGDTNLFLDNEHYDKILQEVKLRYCVKNNQPLTSKHYQHLKDTML